MPAIIAARHPPRAPIRGGPLPRSTPHHSPSPLLLSHIGTHPPTKLRRHHHFTLVARPLRCSPSSGEPRGESPIPPFPFPAWVGEHRQAGALSRLLSGGFPIRSAVWVHRGPARSCGPRSGDRVHGFFHCEINQKNQNSIFPSIFKKEAPRLFQNQPAVQEFTVRPGNLKNNSEKVLNLRKIHKNSSKTSKIHIFSTTTPKPVILVPKFSESLPLSFCAFI
jgi:hypothetical protein